MNWETPRLYLLVIGCVLASGCIFQPGGATDSGVSDDVELTDVADAAPSPADGGTDVLPDGEECTDPDFDPCVANPDQCGTVEVPDACGRMQSSMCECPDDMVCRDSRCECPPGWKLDPDTGECVAAPECEPACGENAHCFKDEDANFTCRCDDGFVPSGPECVRELNNEWVVRVQRVDIEVPDGLRTVTTNLADRVEPENSVLFATKRTTEVGNSPLNSQFDLYLSDGETVVAGRAGSVGSASIRATVIEFDPTFVRVEQGAFQLVDGEASTTINLDDAVVPAHAFTVFTYKLNSTSEFRNSWDLMGRLADDGANLTLRRAASVGEISGHWWIVEAKSGEFDVQRPAIMQLGENDTSVDESVQPFQLTSSFRNVSSFTTAATGAPAHANVGCVLLDGGLVRCSRIGAEFSAEVSMEIVTLNAPEQAVLRGSQPLQGNTGTALPGVPGLPSVERAMEHLGTIGRFGAQPTNVLSMEQSATTFVRAELQSGGTTRIELSRGGPRTGGETTDGGEVNVLADWEVIVW